MMTKENILELNKLEEYREGNRLEVKAAQGGGCLIRCGTAMRLSPILTGLHPVGRE